MKITTFATSLAAVATALSAPLDGNDRCNVGFLTESGPHYGYFKTTCWNQPGDFDSYHSTELDLSLCLGIDKGSLVWADNGGAMRSCTGCKSGQKVPNIIECDCPTGNGGEKKKTSIDVNARLYKSKDGRLSCFNHSGSLGPPPSTR